MTSMPTAGCVATVVELARLLSLNDTYVSVQHTTRRTHAPLIDCRSAGAGAAADALPGTDVIDAVAVAACSLSPPESTRLTPVLGAVSLRACALCGHTYKHARTNTTHRVSLVVASSEISFDTRRRQMPLAGTELVDILHNISIDILSKNDVKRIIL
jgi:hypothetical protein